MFISSLVASRLLIGLGGVCWKDHIDIKQEAMTVPWLSVEAAGWPIPTWAQRHTPGYCMGPHSTRSIKNKLTQIPHNQGLICTQRHTHS